MEEMKAFTIQLPVSQWRYIQREYGERGMSHFLQQCVTDAQKKAMGHQDMISMLDSISRTQDTIINLLTEGGK